MAQRFIVVDLETTGNSPKKGDRIIQFAAVMIEEGQIVNEYSAYFNPGQEISMFIEELTGITNQMVDQAPSFEEAAEQISLLLEDVCFVAHNVNFDLTFLKEELQRCGYEARCRWAIDTVELAKILKPTADGYKLNQLAKDENFEHTRPHRADSDAYVTAMLFLQMQEKLDSLPAGTLKQLQKLSQSMKSDIANLIGERLNLKLTRKEEYNPDLEVYRGLALKKGPSAWTDNPDIPEFPRSIKEKSALLKEAFPDFESRTGQLDMMDTVYHSFESCTHSIIEAGTGIGKSLGYLLPAAYFAVKHEEPVVVSTYTLQLQEQLLHSEVPKLKQILPFHVNVVLLKGRSNYISLAKFERALKEKDHNYETALVKMQILVWLTETESGEKDELNLNSGGELFWERIKCDSLIPPALQHPWRTRDFYEKARQKAVKADIIVTNHAFLMADIMSESPIIPKKGRLVLDEAHHIEQAAAKYLGRRLDYIAVRTLLNRLGTTDQKHLLRKLENMGEDKGLAPDITSDELDAVITDFSFEFEQLFQLLAGEAARLSASGGPGRVPLNLKESNPGIAYLAERLMHHLSKITRALENRTALLKQVPLSKNSLFHLTDVEMAAGRLKEAAKSIKEFFIAPESRSIYWIEFTKSQQGIRVSSQPVGGNRFLWESCFSERKSVVFTSATLSVKDSFSFFIEQLGMQQVPVRAVSYPSTFDYRKNARVLVATDIPEVTTIPSEAYAAAAARHIVTAAEASKGRMMVLFTSHELLKSTFEKVKNSGFLQEFSLMAQGITGGSKMKLLRNFQSYDKSVLFGTTSLWEGVDIPGEDLSCLVIVRLPFTPPDDPVASAKGALLEKQGRNPFYVYSLPEAVLRFRQGFGRLIRTSTDRGVLIVLDRRITTAPYGKEFRKALPPVEWLEAGEGEMFNLIEEWI